MELVAAPETTARTGLRSVLLVTVKSPSWPFPNIEGRTGFTVGVGVPVGVVVLVTVGVLVWVAVGVLVAIGVGVNVCVGVAVTVGVLVDVPVGVTVGVEVGNWLTLAAGFVVPDNELKY